MLSVMVLVTGLWINLNKTEEILQGLLHPMHEGNNLRFYIRGDSANMEISLNTYEWLKDRLEYCERLDDIFHRWAQRPRNEKDNWICNMENFPKYLKSFGIELTGIYGNGDPFTVNTCNHESALDAVLQFLSTDTFVILQVHRGGDIRGNYSMPHVFEHANASTDILCDRNLSLYCGGDPHPKALCPNGGMHLLGGSCTCRDIGNHSWSSDNAGYRFSANNYEKPLPNCKVLENYEEWTPGTLWVIDEDTGLCPECGAKLYVGSY